VGRSGNGQQPAHARALVTGCAGFIGSHLCRRLLDQGTTVVGVDSFTNFYARELKKTNLAEIRDDPGFELSRVDLSRDSLEDLLNGVDVVYHLAGQPGVRASFGGTFRTYVRNNIEATQRLIEAAIDKPLQAFVYASSSSVYGDEVPYPTPESAPATPLSPYGMTKVSVEQLAGVYYRTHGIPVVGLRYFSIYGPRQRPDMAFARFIGQMLIDQPITVYGDGRQVRDFTFVADAVEGTLLAALRGRPGAVYNIGGGHPVELTDAIEMLSAILERPVDLLTLPRAPGDVMRTGADGTLAREALGFEPRTSLQDGLQAQVKAALHDLPKLKRRMRRWHVEAHPGV
jgi:nucleoside-diphosphate-sugar epimerase